MSDPDGAWIFLSHSTKDWDEVRRVRNLLEEKGHRPLVFFLKCITDESELDGLLRREIDARSWFLLCNSENAQTSSWVQAEVAYIKSLHGKYHEEIDLDSAIETQVERIDRLCKRATVYLSYARADSPAVRRIADALGTFDYRVWFDLAASAPGQQWAQQVAQAIDEAIARGFVVLLLSVKSVQSNWTRMEIKHALQRAGGSANGANIVPVMLEDPAAVRGAMPAALEFLLAPMQWLDFSRGDFDQNIAKLVQHMNSRTMD